MNGRSEDVEKKNFSEIPPAQIEDCALLNSTTQRKEDFRNLLKNGKRMKKKILVVDNHPLMLNFMSRLLEKEGHQVLTAEDGLSALEVLKIFTPDVIFIDLIMPHIGGEKLCQII